MCVCLRVGWELLYACLCLVDGLIVCACLAHCMWLLLYGCAVDFMCVCAVVCLRCVGWWLCRIAGLLVGMFTCGRACVLVVWFCACVIVCVCASTCLCVVVGADVVCCLEAVPTATTNLAKQRKKKND